MYVLYMYNVDIFNSRACFINKYYNIRVHTYLDIQYHLWYVSYYIILQYKIKDLVRLSHTYTLLIVH